MRLRDVLPAASFAAVQSAISWLDECRNQPIDPIPQYRRYRPSYRFTARETNMLRQMAKAAVWAEVGGKAAGWQGQQSHGFKSQREMNEQGQGRTQWVGMPEWAKGLNLNNAEITEAVEKAIAGQALGKRQRLLVQVMMNEMAEGDAIQPIAPDCPF